MIMGCGLTTALAQIVAEELEIDPSLINVMEADTERGLYDIGTYASRNTYVGGALCLKGSPQIKELLLQQAAILLNYSRVSGYRGR